MDEPNQGRAGEVRRITEQVSIDAPVGRVWAIITDVRQMPGVHPRMLSAHWLDGLAGAGLGARFASTHVHEELGVWRAVSRIVEFTEQVSVAWSLEGDVLPPAVCRFDLEPGRDPDSGGERTLLRQTYFYDPRPGASPPVEQALAYSR
jgi:uncharacterized membrane protein